MSRSLDCRDGQHEACHESGGCGCRCHVDREIREAFRSTCSTFTGELLDVDDAIDERHWASFEWPEPPEPLTRHRPLARHASRPRGLARLMSEPPRRSVIVSALVGAVLGIAIALLTAGAML